MREKCTGPSETHQINGHRGRVIYEAYDTTETRLMDALHQLIRDAVRSSTIAQS